jgi:CheY-like chemotaxis protein
MAAVVPDLIILDLRLPDLSGTEVLQQLGRSPVLGRMPVLVVSGFLDEEPHDGFGFNVVGVLPKPLGLPRLLDEVDRALSGKAAARQNGGSTDPALDTAAPFRTSGSG